MKTAFFILFFKIYWDVSPGTIHQNLKKMWKNKFSETNVKWQSMYGISILVFVSSFCTEWKSTKWHSLRF